MAAVGNFEVVIEEQGPFTGTTPRTGQVNAPEGKVFLGLTVTGSGPAGQRTATLSDDATAFEWRLTPTAASAGSIIRVVATCAEMGQ